jgi:hypothetical protein
MNRNTVIVDGTKPGSAACSRKLSAQNFGPSSSKGPQGVNGMMVWKADDVSIENLTVCNFLGGSAGEGVTGNEIWWNGGANGDTVGGWGFYGSYLNATSTFFHGDKTAAQYGIFSSNWSGGTWNNSYASNFSDSAYYIGACQQICDQTVDHAWAQYSSLGYSGSNSGGQLVVENSQFDQNKDGFDTNSQNGNNPAPQNGACPGNGISPITHTHSCWVFMDNYVHDNNDPNVPRVSFAAFAPTGAGMTISGGRNDTIMHNRFANNGAWGVSMQPFPDSGPPCTGGTLNSPLLGPGGCLFDEYGNALIDNTFSHDGGFGNRTNGDFVQGNTEAHPPNCFSGNVDTSGALSPGAAALEQAYPACTGAVVTPNLNVTFFDEFVCDSGIVVRGFGCQPGDHYPRRTRVVMHALPRNLASMPNPCAGVPINPWCPARRAS